MALRTKSGAKLTGLRYNLGAFAEIRKTSETEDLLDRIASTIANAADREVRTQHDNDVDITRAEFAVDGGTSSGRRGRYRSSVRTRGFEAIFAEARYNALTKALAAVVRKF
jgi:hypothetical protein